MKKPVAFTKPRTSRARNALMPAPIVPSNVRRFWRPCKPIQHILHSQFHFNREAGSKRDPPSRCFCRSRNLFSSFLEFSRGTKSLSVIQFTSLTNASIWLLSLCLVNRFHEIFGLVLKPPLPNDNK